MDWFNRNAGVMVLLLLIISVIAFGFLIYILMTLKSRIAVQRLKLVGFYSRDADSRENYAEFTVGNRSLNDVGVAEIGLQNGKINIDYTSLFMRKANINPGSRIVIDQRSSVTFRMTQEELQTALLETPKGKKLYRLRLYVVDLPGNVYYGNMRAVRKLLAEYLRHTAALPAYNAGPSAPTSACPAEPLQNAESPIGETAEPNREVPAEPETTKTE